MPRYYDERRLARDGAASTGDGFDSFSAGDVAVAQSLDRSAVQVNGDGPVQVLQPIGKAEIAKAYETLQKYKEGKANLERRLVQNQQWYKLRQWECMRTPDPDGKKRKSQVEPVSAWLLNSIANKHADAMDNFPSANILPREDGDRREAKMLSSIIPVILDQCDFEGSYSLVMDEKIESGTGVYGVFWDAAKNNGLGDIDIVSADLINLFWESGVTDIQRSRNLFYVTLQDNDILEQDYPQMQGKLTSAPMELTKYIYDDTIDTNDKSAVVDWYYKKRGTDGKTVLHFCKFIAGQDEALFATENDPEYAERGWYDHGLYPFVFDPLMRCKGTPTGFGFIDVGKSAQEYIDRGDKAILENMLFNARPRHFIRQGGGVNEEEFADANADFVHVDGQLGQDSILPVQPNPLPQIYVTMMANKVQELKETTGNRDVSTGGSTGGVTAASAIAAMQEAGSKLSRDINKSSYRAFRKVVLMCIELIRQFYDMPRYFRILGQGGMEEFVQYSNAGILPQPQGQMVNGFPMEMGVDVGYRLPLFDVEVTAEKQSPYSRMAQNEMALELYARGFFAPNNADASLACLDMMDFDRKDFVVQKVQTNGTLYQKLMMATQMAVRMAAYIDQREGSQLAASVVAQLQGGGGSAGPQLQGGGDAKDLAALGETGGGESSITRNARTRVAQSTAPR